MINPIKFRLIIYLSLICVAIASFMAVLFLPDSLKSVAGGSFVSTLFIALIQILRDMSSFEKEKIKQSREHAFVAAFTSHMSQVVFDKHVCFAEEYVKTLQDVVLKRLFIEGPAFDSRFGLDYSQPLYDVRKKHILWISPLMDEKLEEFESILQGMGARAQIGNKRNINGFITRANELYIEILGLNEKKSDEPELNKKKSSYKNLVIEHLQQILNIDKLTRLRDSIIDTKLT